MINIRDWHEEGCFENNCLETTVHLLYRTLMSHSNEAVGRRGKVFGYKNLASGKASAKGEAIDEGVRFSR